MNFKSQPMSLPTKSDIDRKSPIKTRVNPYGINQLGNNASRSYSNSSNFV